MTGRRLSAWITSTVQRFRQELDRDRKCVLDKSIEKEVKLNFNEALVADIAKQENEQRALAARVRAEVEAGELAQTIAARRQTILAAMPSEPKPTEKGEEPGVVTVVVRLPSGVRASRRFSRCSDTQLLFDWLDAFYHVEVGPHMFLKSGDGQFSCQYNGSESKKLLSEAGLDLEDRGVILNVEYTTRK